MSSKTESEPGKVQAENGIVIVDGPNAVALSMTPSAAEAMGKLLIEAAQQACTHPEAKEERRHP